MNFKLFGILIGLMIMFVSASCSNKQTSTHLINSTTSSSSKIPTTNSLIKWQSKILQSPARFGNSVIKTIGGKSYAIYSVGIGIIIETNPNANAIADTGIGIDIFDVSDPNNPTEISYLKSDHENNGTYNVETGLQLLGSILYVTTSDYLWIVDVSDLYSPKEIGIMSSINGSSLVISGNYAYLISGTDPNTIVALDISDLAHPKIIGSLISQSSITRIISSGDLLLALSLRELNIIDISSPGKLKEIGSLPDPFPKPIGPIVPEHIDPSFLDMAIFGSNIYVVSGINKLLVIDISNPSIPKIVSTVETQEQGTEIIISGKYAYLLCSNGPVQYSMEISDSISRIDISDLSKLQELRVIQFPQPTDIYSQNYYYSLTEINDNLYLTRNSSPTIEIIKLGDIFTPLE